MRLPADHDAITLGQQRIERLPTSIPVLQTAVPDGANDFLVIEDQAADGVHLDDSMFQHGGQKLLGIVQRQENRANFGRIAHSSHRRGPFVPIRPCTENYTQFQGILEVASMANKYYRVGSEGSNLEFSITPGVKALLFINILVFVVFSYVPLALVWLGLTPALFIQGAIWPFLAYQ